MPVGARWSTQPTTAVGVGVQVRSLDRRMDDEEVSRAEVVRHLVDVFASANYGRRQAASSHSLSAAVSDAALQRSLSERSETDTSHAPASGRKSRSNRRESGREYNA
jgi:hypothetical protein